MSVMVHLFDQQGSQFATFDMPELPRKDDVIEIGFPNEEHAKSFSIHRIVHRMVQLPRSVTDSGTPMHHDPPWRWEIQAHGSLFDPAKEVPRH